jgi:hypothetical protein
MAERQSQSRSLHARGLCKVTLLVPEGNVEILRQFARELCARQANGPDEATTNWRKLSLSAELMVDPEYGARCAIRDTGATGAARYHWTVSLLGKPNPVAAGRAGERAEARSLGEAALSAFVEDWRQQSGWQSGHG